MVVSLSQHFLQFTSKCVILETAAVDSCLSLDLICDWKVGENEGLVTFAFSSGYCSFDCMMKSL